MPDFPQASFELTEQGVLKCHGEWTFSGLSGLREKIESLQVSQPLTEVDGSEIEAMDSAGAVLLYEWIHQIKGASKDIKRVNFKKEHEALIQLVSSQASTLEASLPPPKRYSLLAAVGKESIEKSQQAIKFLTFFG